MARKRASQIAGLLKKRALLQTPGFPFSLKLTMGGHGKRGGHITRLERLRKKIRTKRLKSVNNNHRRLPKKF